MVLIKTYIESVPESLEESAMIDGAGYYLRYFLIVMPLCKPILATVVLFCMVGQWNSLMDTLIYVSNYRLHTLQFLLYLMINNPYNIQQMLETNADISTAIKLTPTTVRLTVTVIVTFPILLAYPFLQKYFIHGIMIGAIKG